MENATEEPLGGKSASVSVDSMVMAYSSELPLSAWMKVLVKDPTKRIAPTLTLQDTYVVYLIETRILDKTKVCRQWSSVHLGPDAEGDISAIPGTFTIWRRYSEFDQLREYLLVMFPFLVVPPLPEKRTTSAWQVAVVDQLDPEFLERRRIGLETFLRRLCHIPEISQDLVLLAFFKEEDWRSLLMSSNYRVRIDPMVKTLSASYRLKRPNSVFEGVKKYAGEIELHISNILKVRARTAEHLYGLHKIHANYGREFSEWSSIESCEMAEQLQKIGHYIDSFAQEVDTSVENEEDFADELKEYYGYCDSLRQICKKQELLQLELEQAEDLLQTRTVQHENFVQGKTGILGGLKAKVFGGITNEQKEEKRKFLEEQVEEATEKAKMAKYNLELFEQKAVANIEKFHTQKVQDMNEIFVNFIILSIDRCKRSRATWIHIKNASADI